MNRAPAEIEAEWLDWVNRFGGEVWARPGLSRAQRSIATISILSVLRETEPLRVHIEAGLANGLTRSEISEVIMHSAVYAGVPQALRSMRIRAQRSSSDSIARRPARAARASSRARRVQTGRSPSTTQRRTSRTRG